MHVQVVRVEAGENGLRTALKTSGGVVWTYWRGDPPTRGQFIDAELAIAGALTWGRELEPLTSEDATASPAALGVLHAVLERYESDGTAVLRVGNGVVLVTTRGTPPTEGTPVRLRGGELTAYPTHL